MEIKLVTKKEDLLPYMNTLKACKVIAIDTETTGLDPHYSRLRLIQIACVGLPVLIVDCFKFLPADLVLLAEIINSTGIRVFHNAKFDIQFLFRFGALPRRLFDTMLAAQLLRSSGGPESAGLKSVVWHYLEEDVNKEEQTSDWSGELTQQQIYYAALDAEILLRLRQTLVKEIYENGLQRVAEIEFQCARAVAFMEYHGINLDMEKWGALTAQRERERAAALEKLYKYSGRPAVQTSLWGDEGSEEIIGYNFDSNDFVVELLRKNGVPVKSTSRWELYPYRELPLVVALSEYRKAAKSLSAFLNPLPKIINHKTGRLHARYGQISTSSGRMSCYRPNVQQIPRENAFRECFTAPRGRKLLTADYSQIELRVAAQIAKDERMIRAFNNGDDLHLLTASLLQNKPMTMVTKTERQAAKAVNFGLIFGMGAAGLRQSALLSYGVDLKLDQAAMFRERFFNAYAGIKRWHNSVKAWPPSEGRTLTGRKFTYPADATLPTYLNLPVQGTAADIMKLALGLIISHIDKKDTYIAAVIHDEILLESSEERAEETAALLKKCMEEAGSAVLTCLPVVAEVNIADSWAGK